MKLEHLLMGVLATRPRTGYDLKKVIDTQLRFLRSNTQMSQVYRTLGAMEDRGWAEHTVEPRPGATDAKRYALTEEGVTVFLDWLTGPYTPPTRYEDPEFHARLAFAGFMTREQLLHLLDTEISVRTEEIRTFRHRDRTEHREPATDFDVALADFMNDAVHYTNSVAKDSYVARLARLREVLATADDLEAARESLVPEHYTVEVDS
ncbi:PadR family transcriptional regulator [Nesterenkonia sp. F]|uniref:PadR family transcriptional regulator n=1 Tax=Nesterenkonia sp. F TaxID=795955 RepID=UPI000255CA09|nr:PadR family transcriptional regulator [Nesterenkonia sp. F]